MDYNRLDEFTVFFDRSINEELKAIHGRNVLSIERLILDNFFPDDLPKFTLKEFTDSLPINKFYVGKLCISSFLFSSQGVELFVDIDELEIVEGETPYKKLLKELNEEQVFFTVDLLWYPHLKELSLSRFDNILNLDKTKVKKIFLCGSYIEKEYNDVKFPKTLERLIIMSKIKDLSFIGKLQKLKYLRVEDLKLVDFSPLKDAKELEELEIWHPKKNDYSTLKSKSIKGLCFVSESRARIPSLDFIKNLPNLESLSLGHSLIEDNDLTPLIEHPTLKSFFFHEKRSYNYTIEEIEKIRENGYVKKENTNNQKKISYKLPYFEQEINSNDLDSYYDTVIKKEGQEINIDLNFEASKLETSEFDKIKMFLGNLEAQNIKNIAYINADFKDKNSTGSVQEFLEFHLKELADELGGISEQELLSKVKLQRVGIYPDSTDAFAICDYGIGTEVSNYIIVLYLDETGNLSDMSWES